MFEERDPRFYEAAELCIAQQRDSTPLLQRGLAVTYAHAVELMDQLEAAGVLGPARGALPRAVLMSIDELCRLDGRA